MKVNANLGWKARTKSKATNSVELHEDAVSDNSTGKIFNMNVDLLRNVDTSEIEHVVVLDKSLLQGISAGKGMFDSAMDVAGATGFTSGSDQINSFLPNRRSQSQQIIDSMFDVAWDNGMEDRARSGSSGSNTMSVGDAYERYRDFVSFREAVDDTIEEVQETWDNAQRALDGDTDAMIDLGVDIAQSFTPWYIDPIIEAIGDALKGASNWLTDIYDTIKDSLDIHDDPDGITGGGGSNDLLLSKDHLLKEKILRGVNPRINPSEEDQGNNYGIIFVEDPTSYLSGSNLGTSTGQFFEDGGAIIATGKHIDSIFSSHGGSSTGGHDNI